MRARSPRPSRARAASGPPHRMHAHAVPLHGVLGDGRVALGAPVARGVARAGTDEQRRLRVGHQRLRRTRCASCGSGRFHSSGSRASPSADRNPRKLSSTCSSTRGAMRALVNSHCSSRARARSKPRRTARAHRQSRPGWRAATAACAAAGRSGVRAGRRAAPRSATRPARLSMVINSTPGSRLMSRASVRPMIQVSRVAGHARCSVRTSGYDVTGIADGREPQNAHALRRRGEIQHGKKLALADRGGSAAQTDSGRRDAI